MRLARSQRRTGTRRPQRGAVGRVRLSNVTDDAVVGWPPVRWCWVGGRSRSGGRASAATARSCGSSVARGARRRGVRRRCPGRCTVGRAARRGSRAPACGRWQGSIPVADALWVQRLTPSPAPGRHVAPAGAGPRAPGVMVSFCDVGSAAAPREVLEAAYSGTCRAPSRNPTRRGPDD